MTPIPYSAHNPIIGALDTFESIVRCPACGDLVFAKEQCAPSRHRPALCPRRLNFSLAGVGARFVPQVRASLSLSPIGARLSLSLMSGLTTAGKVG